MVQPTSEKFKSLFDTIEEQTSSPCLFNWIPNTHVNITAEEILLDSDLLIISSRGGLLKQRRCVLTHLYLIRHNVFFRKPMVRKIEA